MSTVMPRTDILCSFYIISIDSHSEGTVVLDVTGLLAEAVLPLKVHQN